MEIILIYSQPMVHSVETVMVMDMEIIQADPMETVSLMTLHNGGTQTVMGMETTRMGIYLIFALHCMEQQVLRKHAVVLTVTMMVHLTHRMISQMIHSKTQTPMEMDMAIAQ